MGGDVPSEMSLVQLFTSRFTMGLHRECTPATLEGDFPVKRDVVAGLRPARSPE